jgi:hypothetical protein
MGYGSWGMGQVQTRRDGDSTQYLLDGRPLSNGVELELRLGGSHPHGSGWASVTVAGLPQALRVRWTGDDGQALQTTLPPEAQVRWP